MGKERMKLYIFRHGETEGNVKNVCQDGSWPLNETGLKQAENLRDILSEVNLPIVYASPYVRAHKTGEIVASAVNAEVFTLDGLQEFYFGDAEGLYESEVYEKYGYEFTNVCNVWDGSGCDVKMPNGESRAEALLRFKNALDFIKKECRFEKAGVATHGHIMRIFYYDYFKEDRLFKNCEYFVLEI